MSSEQDQAKELNKQMQDPMPKVSSPLPGTFNLLAGIQDPDTGEWSDAAVVRELTGRDEEQFDILRKKEGLTYTDFYTAIVVAGLVSVGGTPSDAKLVDRLIEADRNLVFLETLKATYGTDRDITRYCPHCNAKNDITIELDQDFPIKGADIDLRAPLEVKTSKGTFKLRLPNGADLAAGARGNTTSESSTAIISRVLVFEEGEEPFNREEYTKDLNFGVRKELFNALLEVEAGPDMGEVDTQCATCGEDMPIAFDWVSLLLG